MPSPAFAIFEGGGAKGIAHVGALRVVESYDFELQGVAGTSAGSLIAALIAAGYRSEEIMRVSENKLARHLLEELQRRPIDLLSRRHWPKIERLRNGGVRSTAAWIVASVVALAAMVFTLRGDQPLFVPLAASALLLVLPLFIRAWARAFAAGWAVYRFMRYRGLLTTQAAAEAVNTMLRRKLVARAGSKAVEVAGQVTFKDIERFGACPLRIIATPVGGDRPMVFGGETGRDVIVAEAVAASISIPGVFSPTTIPSLRRPEAFVDGGMMANLPAWVFAEEKLMFERRNPLAGRVPILAFTLDDAAAPAGSASPRRPDSVMRYLGDVLRAGIFGSQRPVVRFIDDLHLVPIRTSLGTLDFTAGPARAVIGYREGMASAFAHLGPRFDKLASIPNELARQARAARDAIGLALAAEGDPRLAKIRMCIVEPEGARSYRVTYTDGMEEQADDQLLLDRDNLAAPWVFRSGKPNFVAGPQDKMQSRFMTKYERTLIWPSLNSVISLPILEDGTVIWHPDLHRPDQNSVIAALCIDSDIDLLFVYNDLEVMARLGTGATNLAKRLAEFHRIRERSR